METSGFIPFEPIFVPREMWSEYEEKPFHKCSVCEKEFGQEDTYEIQKVSNGRETVFEIAICLNCSIGLASEYSKQSTQAISTFINEQLDLSFTPGQCNLCGEKLTETRSCSTCGVCRGHNLILPLIHICDRCEEDIQELISEKTRKAHYDFINRVIPGIPAEFDFTPTMLL